MKEFKVSKILTGDECDDLQNYSGIIAREVTVREGDEKFSNTVDEKIKNAIKRLDIHRKENLQFAEDKKNQIVRLKEINEKIYSAVNEK